MTSDDNSKTPTQFDVLETNIEKVIAAKSVEIKNAIDHLESTIAAASMLLTIGMVVTAAIIVGMVWYIVHSAQP